jgi:hypothetical protein
VGLIQDDNDARFLQGAALLGIAKQRDPRGLRSSTIPRRQ